MPLTEAEKIDVRMLLGVRSGLPAMLSGPTALDKLTSHLDGLSEDAAIAVRAILSEFNLVRFQSGELTGEYASDPRRQRALLRRQLITVLDFDPADYAVLSPGLHIEREA